MAKTRTFFKLSFKFIIIISFIIVLTSIALSLFFINAQKILLKSFVENKAIIIANTLATTSEYSVLNSSKDVLAKLTANTINEEDVLYSVIYDKNCMLLSETEIPNENIVRYVQSTPIDSSVIDLLDENKIQKENISISDIGEVIEVLVPIFSKDDDLKPTKSLFYRMSLSEKKVLIGVVRVGLSFERINYQIKKMTRTILLITLIVVLVGIIISSFIIKIIVQPIKELTIGTKKIAAGNFSYRVPLTSRDEFRDLANSFNSMATDMEIHIRELNKEKKELLNLKVAFEQRSQELEETLDKVQLIQQDLIKSEKFAAVGRLSSSVAHELRNPLAGIKNISYFLSKMGTISDTKSKHMVEMLSAEVARANKIITDLLDFSKTRKLNKQEISIETFIEKAISSVPMPANITIVKNIEKFKAVVDPDKMTQILINLITNAKDAMAQKGGTITITVKKDLKKFYVILKDTGCGMDEKTLTHLFEPLFTTKLKGIGLGLSIVKEIVESHSGKISVDSIKNIGTTFTIEIPFA